MVSYLSEEARLFLLKEKLTEWRRKKKYSLIVWIASPFAVGTLSFVWDDITKLSYNTTIDLLIRIIGGIFSVFMFSYYLYTRSEEKKIMQRIQEMAYGKTTEKFKND